MSTPSLNTAQMEAVHYLGGPCLVLAGAGSGKTRVITHKIARLLQAGLEPSQIAAITFTNKASQEMRERSKALVGPRAAQKLAVSTFHSLGVRILRTHGEHLGLKPRFSIFDSDDVLGILKDAGATTDNAIARRWQWAISGWKNQGWGSAEAEAAVDGMAASSSAESSASRADLLVAARVMKRYEERLTAYQAVDFDDLIVLPAKLLQRDEDVREAWQKTFRHVLVDEYQDTNAVQYEMLKLLTGSDAMFTVVGDDDQSIYGWRGATLENLRRLPQDFPHLRVIALEQNYRSTGSILRAANALIANNPKLYEKKLWSALGDGEPVMVIDCDSEEHEAERAVARIKLLRNAGGTAAAEATSKDVEASGQASVEASVEATASTVAYRDFAVLYRANHQARVFEQALRRAAIPYRVSGGQSFFDRAEIRDLCAWLRLLVNNDDDPAFLRAVGTPKRGIGPQTLTTLGQFASRWKTSLFEALFADSLASVLSTRAVGSLHEFGRYVNDLEYRARHTTGAEDAKTFLLEWLHAIGYEAHLHDGADSPALATSRWVNVIDFIDWMARRCGGELTNDGSGTVENEAKSVLEVAQAISVIASLAERKDEQNVVTLSTLHAAKGLEWPHVVLAGVNEGALPFSSEDEETSATRLEEERRLMYVGVTRARHTLVVSTLNRRKRGRKIVAGVPSRFIGEMKLDEQKASVHGDPRARLKALRDAAAERAAKVVVADPTR